MSNHILFTVVWFYSLAAFLPLSMFLLYKWPHLWSSLLAVFLGIVTAIIDLGVSEVQFPVLLLLVFGFFLGFHQPKNAWRWALLLSVWVPIFGIAKIILTNNFDKFVPEGVGSFLAIIPAFIGVYCGAFIRSSVTHQQTEG